MGGRVSSYYPPRARWYSPLLTGGERLRKRLALDRLHWPNGLSPAAVVVSMVVPGAGFYFRAPRFWGRLALGLSVLLILVIVGGFGYPVAALGFGLLLSLHACGLVFVLDPLLVDAIFRTRLLFGGGILIALLCLVYLPGRDFIQRHLFLPLQVNGRVVVVKVMRLSTAWRRGERVAYSFGSHSEHQLVIHGGVSLGPVLAAPGDHVQFSASDFEVNGFSQPRLALMPSAGAFVVPEKHWLVWPEVAISGHGQVPTSDVAEALLNLCTISEDQFVGKPVRRWLWRKQF
jgi:hypothetical protein